MANTGNITVTERDMNPLSPTYDTTRTRTYQDLRRCPTDDLLFKIKYQSYVDGSWITIPCDGNSETGTNAVHSHTRVVEIGYCVDTISYKAFNRRDGYDGITNLTMSETVETIGESAFEDDQFLTNIVWSPNITSIGRRAFLSVPIVSLTLSKVQTLGAAAFGNCRSLTTITIGDSITSIGNEAFATCIALRSFTCLATTPPTLGEKVFYDMRYTVPLPQITIYVPAASVSAYQSASGWSTYASRIQAIPS